MRQRVWMCAGEEACSRADGPTRSGEVSGAAPARPLRCRTTRKPGSTATALGSNGEVASRALEMCEVGSGEDPDDLRCGGR
ncbi:hypothetical protein NDU88_005964 [Pleurodeles waltl]|uniref:Uncharacterized protein n=1 Tax=Pleurodeles waltl TaxID=8319 RepID=A0AAV7UJQ6_PLEWA|nr:hypothetical protein NDU88_005964 [Pleurodeles waltl]